MPELTIIDENVHTVSGTIDGDRLSSTRPASTTPWAGSSSPKACAGVTSVYPWPIRRP